MTSQILILGTADWDQAIATNQHYMTRELGQVTDVTFCESMGLRRPEPTLRDVRRVISRLARIVAPEGKRHRRQVPQGVTVVSPAVLPRHVGMARRINQGRVLDLFRDWIESTGPRILWTYTPVTYGLEHFATATVYHCVDLLAEIPGIDRRVVDAGEKRLALQSDHVSAIASSAQVRSHLEDVDSKM